MDATRSRRVKSASHQQWYARWRTVRFASHLGFLEPTGSPQVAEVRGNTEGQPVLLKEIGCWKNRSDTPN